MAIEIVPYYQENIKGKKPLFIEDLKIASDNYKISRLTNRIAQCVFLSFILMMGWFVYMDQQYDPDKASRFVILTTYLLFIFPALLIVIWLIEFHIRSEIPIVLYEDGIKMPIWRGNWHYPVVAFIPWYDIDSVELMEYGVNGWLRVHLKDGEFYESIYRDGESLYPVAEFIKNNWPEKYKESV